MNDLKDADIQAILVNIISDGFNRSLEALEKAGAIETKVLISAYGGAGSKYYDLVTEQIVYTAKLGSNAIRDLIASNP